MELRVQFDQQTGEVSVHGPVHDKILCMGLLELAKTAVMSHNTEPVIKQAKLLPRGMIQ